MAGLKLHQAGRLAEAEAIYRQVLERDGGNPDALHMLGLIAHQTGQPEKAIELIGMAVRRKSDDPFSLNNLGASYMAARRAGEAADCFRRALRLRPDYPEALANLGNALKAEGNLDEAIVSYRKAVAADSANSAAWNNLGNTLRERGRLDEAADCYRQAIAANPRNAEANNNLGVWLAAQGKPSEAVECYRRALAIRPGYAEAHLNLANAFKGIGSNDEAIAGYREAIRLEPTNAEAHFNLGNAFRDMGRTDEAVTSYREAVRLEPGNSVAAHLLAALTGAASDRAPSRYVEGVFDDYADRFDAHLVERLEYRVPENLVALLVKHGRPAQSGWDVLDLGCGTGLAGAAISPHVREMVGVDLSGNMLAKARERNIYGRLVQADLIPTMGEEPAASYDVVMAADVFVYLGRLDQVTAQAARLLRPGGLFAFSVEALEALPEESRGDGQGFVLNSKGRFAHGAAYIERLARDSGLRLREIAGAQTRLDGGMPVQGWLVVMER